MTMPWARSGVCEEHRLALVLILRRGNVSRRLYPLPQLFSRAEKWAVIGRDVNGQARLRITSSSRLEPFDSERAESPQLNAFACNQYPRH